MPDPNGLSDLAAIPESRWAVARDRSEAIRPLLERNKFDRPTVTRRAKECGVHTATLYRWLNRYRKSGAMGSLLQDTPGPAKGSKGISDRAEKILNEIIEGRFLTRQRLSISVVHRDVALRCREEGIPIPSASTLRRRIRSVPVVEQLRRREGGHAAQGFEPIRGCLQPDGPLAIIQIDHTPLDLILVDDIRRLPIGRAFLTLAIDVYSRMIAGFYIAFEEPSALSVGLCLAQAILPKDLWLSKMGITTPWPVHGLMGTVHCDNGREFHGKMLRLACEQYGIKLHFRRVRRPWEGGHIERLLGTFMKEVHALPGTTFSNTVERGGYRSAEKATLTLSEFERWLTTFIVDVYHQRLHRGIGTSPIQKFAEDLRTRTPVVPDAHRLRLDFLPFEMRSVQNYGIALDGIHYYANILRRWINARDPENAKLRRVFVVRRDPREISTIHFFDPETDCYFEVPYRDKSRPGMSLWELRAVKRKLHEEGRTAIDEDLIFSAYAQMRRIEDQAGKRTRQARRRPSVSILQPLPPGTEPATQPIVTPETPDQDTGEITSFTELELW